MRDIEISLAWMVDRETFKEIALKNSISAPRVRQIVYQELINRYGKIFTAFMGKGTMRQFRDVMMEERETP